MQQNTVNLIGYIAATCTTLVLCITISLLKLRFDRDAMKEATEI